jgi:cystathionine gamma-synthase
MAAATAVFQALAPGDHVVAPRVMYWALRNWLVNFGARWGVAVEIVDTDRLDALRAAVKPGRTKLVWIETPANPTWVVTDIAAAAEIAHAAGARLAVDSTVATPVFTKPLSLGADIVMHSATKYLNGHSDVIAGALVTKAQDDFWARIAAIRAQIGGVLGPFEAWLLLRGMRTLYPRVRAAARGALAVAEHCARHPGIAGVMYPGLPSDPGHAVAKKQMQGGFGGMLSIRVAPGGMGSGEAAAIAMAANFKIWKRATSLGGVESLVEHRASVEGAGSPATPDLLRLSVGLEHVDDLIGDIDAALAAVAKR